MPPKSASDGASSSFTAPQKDAPPKSFSWRLTDSSPPMARRVPESAMVSTSETPEARLSVRAGAKAKPLSDGRW